MASSGLRAQRERTRAAILDNVLAHVRETHPDATLENMTTLYRDAVYTRLTIMRSPLPRRPCKYVSPVDREIDKLLAGLA